MNCVVAVLLLFGGILAYQPDRSCGINEVYSPCTQLCPPTCENPNPRCRVDCHRPSCTCIQGYVYSNGRCVPGNSCFQTVQSGRCRSNLDCRLGAYCNNGFCGATSGVYTKTIVTSSSHHHSHSIHGGCSLDVHCPHQKICINGHCVFA